MRILVVCQYYYPEPFRITDICEELVKQGHDVTVLTGLPNYPEGEVLPEYRKKQNRNEKINGVSVLRCYERGRKHGKINMFINYMSFALFSCQYAKKISSKFDIVIANQLSPVMMACAALQYGRRTSTPVLLYCLDLWPASLVAGGIKRETIVYKLFWEISRKIYSQADKIAITSKSFEEYFVNELKINDKEIEYLPQYAESIFENMEKSSNKKDQFDFVFAGNIGEMQSVNTIIEAARLLKDDKRIKIHIVGDGSDLGECKALATNLQNVIFYGRKPLAEMKKFYSLADAMLVTLRDDTLISYTLPGKMQTYMAAGKPIIGAANGEICQVIQEAKCGICTKAEDANMMANSLSWFVGQAEEERAKMGENARQYYDNNFKKEQVIKKLESIMIAMIKKMEKEETIE